ncbi:MAG: hypothetical protein WD114_06705 [Phycisphaerales bacterium]
MPANRSRTDRWRQSLQNIHERGGGLEFAIKHDRNDGVKDLVWRVRVLDLSDDEIVIEQPGAMGQSFRIDEGVELVGIMAVGQNRWMFDTVVLGKALNETRSGTFPALRLRMPDKVERCLRRQSDRTSIAHIDLPYVECWKLLDPLSAVPLEVANRVQIEELVTKGQTAAAVDDQIALPSVGPRFEARLANLGGGGVGLVVPRESRTGIDSGKVFWLRMDLRNTIPAPIVLTAKLAHSHIDSQQNTYAGMAFEFGINNQHKDFVLRQIARYLGAQQQPRKAA